MSVVDVIRTRWVGEAEELGHVDQLGALASNLEVEVGVDLPIVVGLRAVDRGLNLDSNIKGLCRSVKGSMSERKDLRPAMNSVWSGGKRQPRVGHAAVRRKVCADAVAARVSSARASMTFGS